MDKLSWSTSHQKQEVNGKVNSELHEAYFLVPAPPEKNKEIEYYHLTLNYKFEVTFELVFQFCELFWTRFLF